MGRKRSADGGGRKDTGRTGDDQRSDQAGREPDWADEAARARTADDPRAVAPHDRAGVPSTGDRH